MVLEAANNPTKPLRLRQTSRQFAYARSGRAPARQYRQRPQSTLGVLGYATFDEEIDAIIRFAKQAIALHTPTENELAYSEQSNRPHVAIRSAPNRICSYEDALEQAGLTTLVVGQAALLERPEIKDILALLHVVCDHTDSAALMRPLAHHDSAVRRRSAGARRHRRTAQHRATLPRARVGRHRGGGC